MFTLQVQWVPPLSRGVSTAAPPQTHTSHRNATSGHLRSLVCKAAAEGGSTKKQLDGVEVLQELLKAKDKNKRAEELVDDMSKEFFHIASRYLSKARQENNIETVEEVEMIMKAAVTAKDKRLPPEVQLFNKLLRNNNSAERQVTLQENYKYLHEGSYFFQFLEETMQEMQTLSESHPDKAKLLTQLRIIDGQTRKIAALLKESKTR